jgi:triosephosphate isomerase
MQQYIIGNWKMNGTKAEAISLASGLLNRMQHVSRPLPHIIVCPSFPYLMPVIAILENSAIEVGGQDTHPETSGAFTGDVSISQLKDVGCKYVIIGHSERRKHHRESSVVIKKKVAAALKAGLHPILCIGESAEERERGQVLSVIAQQLATDLPEDLSSHLLLIAYEPLWAIGSGKTPTLEQIEEVMGFIKHEISTRMTGGAIIPTIYGGSVNALNASQLLNLPHIDGLLVGGASLKLEEFWQIANASER